MQNKVVQNEITLINSKEIFSNLSTSSYLIFTGVVLSLLCIFFSNISKIIFGSNHIRFCEELQEQSFDKKKYLIELSKE